MAKRKTQGWGGSFTPEEAADIRALQEKMAGVSFSKLVVFLVRKELAAK